eukprot:2704917-Amphidinium_carterae.1
MSSAAAAVERQPKMQSVPKPPPARDTTQPRIKGQPQPPLKEGKGSGGTPKPPIFKGSPGFEP